VKTLVTTRFHWQRPLLLVVFAVAMVAAIIFGLRAYGSFLLLRSAYRLGASDVSSVRAWMTLHDVAGTYQVSETALIQRLGLSSVIDRNTTLRSIAQGRSVSPFLYVQQVQKAISELRRVSPLPSSMTVRSPDTLEGELLAALLLYGYPILELTLLLGTMGMPFPSALSVVVAGSLIAQGQMSWFWSGTVSVTSSVVGDLAGYGLGRVLGREFLERRGRWIGFTTARQARVEGLFQQLGVASVLLSRSLISFLSSAVNLLAGASRYRLRAFLAFAIVGRLIWTLAYLGLGYGFGIVLEASADFLSSLSVLLVSLAALAGLGFMTYRNRASLRAAQG
jgi:membrane-associated protein